MNSNRHNELRIYANAALMAEYNEMMIRVKVNLDEGSHQNIIHRFPKPTVEEIDSLQRRINAELSKDSKPMKRS